MALIERFTPGGNIYPDGSSTFAMLGAFFKRWAENRDSMDQSIAQNATETAVDEAVQAVTPNALQRTGSETIVFAVVDEDGRRTWLEVSAAGGLTEHASNIIVQAVSGPVGVEVGVDDMVTEITELSFAIVDEDGRRTDIELGEDGRFTQRVIDSIGDRLNITPPADPTTAILPSSLPLLVGREYRLYYDSVLGARDPDHVVLTSSSGQGGNVGTHWVYSPTDARSFTLTLTVVDRAGETIRTAAIPVQTYAAPAVAGRLHLAIGDSITRAGNYVGATATAVGATSVGTRTYDEGVTNTEGRGGWSLSGYFTNIGHDSWGDSPFLFPAGVTGEKFWGNTQFWKRVCYDDPTGYDYHGFQRIARGWQDSTAPFLFGTDGYPTSPVEGDVVVDPSFAEAEEFRQYVGGVWTAMSPQPSVEFSFSKYMARYAAAFPSGGPTSVSVMLETNDFFNGIDTAKFDQWRTRMDSLISSIRSYSATIPVVLMLAPTGGPWEKWSGQTVNKWEFDQRMQDAARRILAVYDTADARTNRVYVASALGAIDPANLSDHVHPSIPDGHEQLATPLSGSLARLITEGVA